MQYTSERMVCGWYSQMKKLHTVWCSMNAVWCTTGIQKSWQSLDVKNYGIQEATWKFGCMNSIWAKNAVQNLLLSFFAVRWDGPFSWCYVFNVTNHFLGSEVTWFFKEVRQFATSSASSLNKLLQLRLLSCFFLQIGTLCSTIRSWSLFFTFAKRGSSWLKDFLEACLLVFLVLMNPWNFLQRKFKTINRVVLEYYSIWIHLKYSSFKLSLIK